MSKTYRNSEHVKYGEPKMKKKYNRKIRKRNKQDIDSVPNGSAYKKMNESSRIFDYKLSCSWEQFKNWDWARERFKDEEKMRAFWNSHYKYR